MFALISFLFGCVLLPAAWAQDVEPIIELSPAGQAYCGADIGNLFDEFAEAWDTDQVYLTLSLPEDSSGSTDSLRVSIEFHSGLSSWPLDTLYLSPGEQATCLVSGAPWYCVGDNHLQVDWNTGSWNEGGQLCQWNVPCIAVEPRSAMVNSLELAVHPNPLNPNTVVSFQLPAPALAELAVYDLLGRLAWGRELGSLPAGKTALQLPADQLGSGVYLVQLHAGKQWATRKILVVQ